MVQLSPILHVNERNNEGGADLSPAFYLLETIGGESCIFANVRPEDLHRVQKPAPSSFATSGDEQPEVYQAVYWNPISFPKDRAELVRKTLDGSRIFRVSPTDAASLESQFAKTQVFVIGDEDLLDRAIANGQRSVQVALWDASSKLPWLPCHRIVSGVEWFQAGWMVCLAREHLFFRDVTRELREASTGSRYPQATLSRLLTPSADETVTMLAITEQGAWRIHSKRGWADGTLEHLHPALREVPVVQLHELVLPKGLSLDPRDGSQDARVRVTTSGDEAVEAIKNGAQVAYLLSPIGSEQLRELIQHQQMLPARSVALDVSALEVWNRAE